MISCDFDKFLHSRRESTPPEGMYFLRFSTSGPICRAPLRAPCVFLHFPEIPWNSWFLWKIMKFLEILWFFVFLWFLWFSRQSRLRISDIPKELLVFSLLGRRRSGKSINSSENTVFMKMGGIWWILAKWHKKHGKMVFGGPGQEMGSGMVKIPL